MEDSFGIVAKAKELSSLNRKLKCSSTEENEEFERLRMQNIVKIENIIGKITRMTGGKFINDPANNFRKLVATVDGLMETSMRNWDIATKKIVEEENNIALEELVKAEEYKKKYLVSKSHAFDFDNSYYMFVPIIKHKDNSQIPLDNTIIEARALRNKNPAKFTSVRFEDRFTKENLTFPHPYAAEIEECLEKVQAVCQSTGSVFSSRCDSLRGLSSNSAESPLEQERKSIADTFKLEYFSEFPFTKLFRGELHPTEHNCADLLQGKVYFPKSFEETEFVLIETEKAFLEMLEVLDKASEVAIDLEHHSDESFIGYVCLIQISTRSADFIVDAIKLRKQIHKLNRITSNPQILKVLHGALFDIQWLQRDFGCYVVNLFDTGEAARVLKLASFGLAYLLREYCNIEAEKKYQLADWRTRPLPNNMLYYARSDTHWLLYIYDKLRHRLILRNLDQPSNILADYQEVMQNSAKIALKRYVKPVVKSEKYFNIISRNIQWDSSKEALFSAIWEVRDFTARQLDLGCHVVLSDREMFKTINKLNKDSVKASLNALLNNAVIKHNFDLLVAEIEERLEEVKLKEENKQHKRAETEKKLIESMNNSMKSSLKGKIKQKAEQFSKLISKEEVKVNVNFKSEPCLFPKNQEECNEKRVFDILDYFSQKHPQLKIKVKQDKEPIKKPEKAVKSVFSLGSDMINLTSNKEILEERAKEEEEETDLRLSQVKGISELKKNTRFLKSKALMQILARRSNSKGIN